MQWDVYQVRWSRTQNAILENLNHSQNVNVNFVSGRVSSILFLLWLSSRSLEAPGPWEGRCEPASVQNIIVIIITININHYLGKSEVDLNQNFFPGQKALFTFIKPNFACTLVNALFANPLSFVMDMIYKYPQIQK